MLSNVIGFFCKAAESNELDERIGWVRGEGESGAIRLLTAQDANNYDVPRPIIPRGRTDGRPFAFA